MRTKTALIALSIFIPGLSVASAAGANSNDILLTCQSIDPTFLPFFDVTVAKIDSTDADSYALTISERLANSFPGPIEVPHSREAYGRVTYLSSADLKFSDGTLSVRKLANDMTVGRLNFPSSADVELVCFWVATPQPSIGVSN